MDASESTPVAPRTKRHRQSNGEMNRLLDQDRPAHDWHRFVLSFPPHLVREYIERFGILRQHRVLDPFCGTGTTIVECKKRGIPGVGVEANPFAHFAAQVKCDWSPDPDELLQHSEYVAGRARCSKPTASKTIRYSSARIRRLVAPCARSMQNR